MNKICMYVNSKTKLKSVIPDLKVSGKNVPVLNHTEKVVKRFK